MTPKETAHHADQMRYLMDLVCEATDDRLSEDARMEAAAQVAGLSHLREVFVKVRDTFYDIANRRTDGLPPPKGWE